MDTRIVPIVYATPSDLLADGLSTIGDDALLSHFVF